MNLERVNILDCKAITRYARNPLLRNSLLIASTRVLDAGCGFLFWMIAARLYSVEEVGLATALISSLGLIIVFSGLGYTITIIRFLPTNNKGKILSSGLIITTATSILMAAIYILLVEFLAPTLSFLKEPEYALIFLLFGVASSVQSLTGIAFIADRKASSFLFQHILLVLKIPLLIPLTFLGAFGIFGSAGIASLIASVFGLIVIHRSISAIRPDIDIDFIRSSFRYTFLSYILNILSIAPTMILTIMVINVLGEAETAKYYIAFAIGNIVGIIPQSLSTSLFVEGSHGEALKKSAIRAAGASFALLFPLVLVLFFFGDRLLGLLSDEYLEAFDLLRIIALSSFLFTVFVLFVSIQRVRMRIESLVILGSINFVLLLGLGYMFIQQYGIIGVGYAWMATYGIVALIIGWIARREKWFSD